MPSFVLVITITIVVLALIFDFINGFHDTANAIATSVATRVLTPRQAIIMSAMLNFLGAFISVSVAKTVGSDIIHTNLVAEYVIIGALLGAIAWNLITWYYGIPSSSSHALIGGLIGSAVVYNVFNHKNGLEVVQWGNLLEKVIIPLILSPILGFVIGFLFMIALNWILRKVRPATVTKVFSKAQIASAAAMALNHGLNDAQKSMGVISLALFSGGLISTFYIPVEVKMACALAMALGTSIGGWKIIKTMGVNMAHLAPVNGFAAETSAAVIIFTASMFKAPVSTTHIISTAIMGVGASKRLTSVRWSVAKQIVWAWVFTIPVAAILSGTVMFIIMLIGKLFQF
ncbi:MAG TPA: inorganic phosphate transporter [Clostridiaceae bacterium]